MTTEHVYSRIDLETYAADGFDQDKRQTMREHIESCSTCTSYLTKLDTDRRSFLEKYPHGSDIPQYSQRTSTQIRPIFAMAASLLLLVGGLGLLQVYRQPHQDGFRSKGAVSIDVLVMSRGGELQARPDHIYHPGERIQLTYSCAQDSRLILVSIDERGEITSYYPSEGDSSISIQPGQDIPLPHSIELDDYIGQEMLIAVFSEDPVALADVTERIRQSFARAGSLLTMDPVIGHNAEVRTIVYTKTREG